MKNLAISLKIYLLAGLLSLLAVGIGVVGVYGMNVFNSRVQAMQNASERAQLGEKLNSQVLAVVMDSRGIYMSADLEAAEKFATPLLKNLGKTKEILAEWKSKLPAEQLNDFAALEERAQKFIEYRTELVRLAREVSPAEARVYGDNDTNRKSRQELNASITEFAAKSAAEIGTITQEVDDFYTQARNIDMGVLLLGVLTGIVLAYIIGKKAIAQPINDMTNAMAQLATGNTKVIIPSAGRGDEIGGMARAVQVFKDNMIQNAELTAAQEQDQAQRQRRAHHIEMLTNSFRTNITEMLHAVDHAATEMESTAQAMAANAEETSRQTGVVATATAQASGNVQTVASAAEELSSSIREITRQVNQSTTSASTASQEARRTGDLIKNLSDASNRIGEVIGLINDVASQTNLLALNATIEAARAGEAGRGFAVVANEVKALATQTATATDEISTQIAAVQAATKDTVQAITSIIGRIEDINHISVSISAAVEEQSSATTEIARNVQEAAAGTEEVARAIEDVTKTANETGAASGEVLSSAQLLSKQSEDLRREVDQFLEGVMAA